MQLSLLAPPTGGDASSSTTGSGVDSSFCAPTSSCPTTSRSSHTKLAPPPPPPARQPQCPPHHSDHMTIASRPGQHCPHRACSPPTCCLPACSHQPVEQPLQTAPSTPGSGTQYHGAPSTVCLRQVTQAQFSHPPPHCRCCYPGHGPRNNGRVDESITDTLHAELQCALHIAAEYGGRLDTLQFFVAGECYGQGTPVRLLAMEDTFWSTLENYPQQTPLRIIALLISRRSLLDSIAHSLEVL